jgi:outer membrane receptor protein involved in Fe transport
MTDWADLVASVDYVGERRLDNDQENTFAMLPAYTLVGVKLSGRWAGWDLAAQVNNLLDERAVSYAARSTLDPDRFAAYPLPERNVLLTVGRRF